MIIKRWETSCLLAKQSNNCSRWSWSNNSKLFHNTTLSDLWQFWKTMYLFRKESFALSREAQMHSAMNFARVLESYSRCSPSGTGPSWSTSINDRKSPSIQGYLHSPMAQSPFISQQDTLLKTDFTSAEKHLSEIISYRQNIVCPTLFIQYSVKAVLYGAPH